jgi:AhpD family alkylhydroperoxidase
MRLREVERGDRLVWRLLIWFISLVSGMRLSDAARIVLYHKQFFGDPMSRWTHMAMRGESDWTVGERELMAAMTAKWNACVFCVGAHGAIAARVLGLPVVDAALQDVEMAELPARLRATLAFLEVLTRTADTLTAGDARTVLREGVTPQALGDAIAVAACSTSSAAARMPSTTRFRGTGTSIAPPSGCSHGATHSGRARTPSTQITAPRPMSCSGASWRAQERPVRPFARRWRSGRSAARPWRHPTTIWPGRSARPRTKVTDEQVARVVERAGSERAAFELIVASAAGAGLHRWRRGLKALEEAAEVIT